MRVVLLPVSGFARSTMLWAVDALSWHGWYATVAVHLYDVGDFLPDAWPFSRT